MDPIRDRKASSNFIFINLNTLIQVVWLTQHDENEAIASVPSGTCQLYDPLESIRRKLDATR
ncbi:hypothetical protein GCM10022265_31120 [Marinobacter xestospongiae]